MRTALRLATLLLAALVSAGCAGDVVAPAEAAPPSLTGNAAAALDAFFASPVAAAEPDLDRFPRRPGRAQAEVTTAAGLPLRLTYETVLEPTESGYRVTLTEYWPDSDGEAFSAVIYELSPDGAAVSVAGYDGQAPPQG